MEKFNNDAAFDKSRVIFYADRKHCDQILAKREGIVEVAVKFANSYGLKLGFNDFQLCDVIRMYSRDIDKMQDLDDVKPNKYRQAAALAIWLVRLKPIVSVSFQEKNFFQEKNRRNWALRNINELFALFLALSMIVGNTQALKYKADAIWNDYALGEKEYDDIFTIFRYRVVSRHAIAILLEMLCQYKLPALIGKLK